MARTELPNGVILPAEYSDDWYEDMTSNLTKLDDVIGSDSEKLNSNDVAFLRMSSAALTDGGTGNFSDLNSSNKLKTGDYVLDSGRKLYQIVSVDSTNETFTVGNSLFKVTAESDLAPVAESGDYGDLDNRPDLNPYDQHLANTDIHVTTADKSKWNNGISQSYVLRYSSTAITDNSTIAYSTLDNTDNIKVSDKIIDTDGKIFSIVSVDSDNSTVTVGTALVDLALDANVVHTSGDETVAGVKTFEKSVYVSNPNSAGVSSNIILRSSKFSRADSVGDSSKIYYFDKDNQTVSYIQLRKLSNKSSDIIFYVTSVDPNDQNISSSISILKSSAGVCWLRPQNDDDVFLGYSGYAWKDLYTKLINGLTPSSLSLPVIDRTKYVDISGYFTNTGNGDINTYSVTANGWIYLRLTDIGSCQLSVLDSSNNRLYGSTSSGSLEQLCLPVTAGTVVETQWTTSTSVTVAIARFIPCQGNI